MHKKLSLHLLIWLNLITITTASNPNTLEASKPNIIIVLTDDQGMGDLSCMGNTILKTPHIDNFYNSSTRFSDYHVSPTCTPTRSAIMSGCYPFNVGITHTILQRERMALDVYTLPQMLKSAGYNTGLFGKWHLGDDDEYLPQNRGFDEVLMHGAGGIGQANLGDFPDNVKNCYFNNTLLHNEQVVTTKGFCTDVFFQAAKSWILKQEKLDSPYFAYISLNAPHAPMIAPEKYKKRFLDKGYDNDTAARYGMIENIDDNFGQLYEFLQKNNALENTLIIFMTDNGISMKRIKYEGKLIKPFNAGMKGNKNTAHEGGTRVPSFWQWDKIGKGTDIKALTAHIDLYKTFASLSGAKLPSDMQNINGRSLVPLLENPDLPWEDRSLFFHCGRWNTGERDSHQYKKCGVRTSKWRFVNNTLLYDIENDPSESKDVSEDHPEVVKQLKLEYDKWWQSTLDKMVNENLPKVQEWPLHIRLKNQLKQAPLPLYTP